MSSIGIPSLAMGFCVVLFLTALCACAAGASEHDRATPLRLEIGDDGKQIKLCVSHAQIGLVCELWCYEGGPFRYGKGTRREDGSVVLVHTSGKMTATTTFTPQGTDRVAMDILVEGPRDELKQIAFVGPCMQFWHSEAFRRQESLVDFARRCFLYTLRGPVGMMDTARGPMPSFKPDAPENNPPWTQWYVPIEAPHPGSIWAFGSSGDRPLYGLVAVASRDGKWLSAIGCASANTLGQGWHDCIHHVPRMQDYLDTHKDCIRHRTMLYVMPNDRRRLLENFRQDFPDVTGGQALALVSGKAGGLRVEPHARKAPALEVQLGLLTQDAPQNHPPDAAWEASFWGGFVRRSPHGEMWAYPKTEEVDLYVSLASGTGPAHIEGALGGKDWIEARPPEEVPARVWRSSDGAWIAALIWEQAEPDDPGRGVLSRSGGKDAIRSVRGRLFLYKGDLKMLRERWNQAREEWKHATPYRMPVEEPIGSARAD